MKENWLIWRTLISSRVQVQHTQIKRKPAAAAAAAAAA